MRRAHRPSRSDPWPPGPSPWSRPARVPPDPLLHAVRSLQGTTRRAAAAPKRTRTTLGEEAALGALEDFAESDPGPATPRRWRRGRGPRPVHAVPGLPAHGAPRRASPTGAGGAPSTNAIESLNYQLRKGDQEPRSLLSSDEAAVKLLWPADPQQRRTRPRTRQGPGQTRQQTHRPTPRPHHHQLETSPRPTHRRLPRPDHPLPLTRIHRKIDRLPPHSPPRVRRAERWAGRARHRRARSYHERRRSQRPGRPAASPTATSLSDSNRGIGAGNHLRLAPIGAG